MTIVVSDTAGGVNNVVSTLPGMSVQLSEIHDAVLKSQAAHEQVGFIDIMHRYQATIQF